MKENRLSLKPTMEELRSPAFLNNVNPEFLKKRYEIAPEQQALDLYAALVPAVEEVVQTMLETQNKPKANISSFEELETGARSLLNYGVMQYASNHLPQQNEALQQLVSYRNPKESVVKLLTAGTNTAVRFMGETLHFLPTAYRIKYGQPPTSDVMKDIAKKHYLFVAENAKKHIVDLTALQGYQASHTKSFRSAFLELRLNEADILHWNEEFPLHPSFEPQTAHGLKRRAIGCPALHSATIHELWKWHLLGAESIYDLHLSHAEAIKYDKENVVFTEGKAVAD